MDTKIVELDVQCLGCMDIQSVTLIDGTLRDRKYELKGVEIVHHHGSTDCPCKVFKGKEIK